MHWLGAGVPMLAILAAAFLGASCGDDERGPAEAPTSVSRETASPSAAVDPEIKGNITVFAAASLADAFTAAGEGFEAANERVSVTFNFAGSSALATQINEGAPADVFASADTAQLRAVAEEDGVDAQATFATNLPVVVVPAGSDTIRTFGDLAHSGYSLVLAGEDVPIGRYARQILANASVAGGLGAGFSASVLANLRSNETNVRAVLAKVQLGEADAGFVYRTDAASVADEVDVIEIPPEFNVVAQYPIATLTGSGNPDAAAGFVQFILSDEGQAILAEFGFGPPRKN